MKFFQVLDKQKDGIFNFEYDHEKDQIVIIEPDSGVKFGISYNNMVQVMDKVKELRDNNDGA